MVAQTVISNRFLVAAFILLTFSLPVFADERCTEWAALLESAEGRVEWQAPQSTEWQTASSGFQFCYGDRVRVVQERAALRLANDTLVRLQENSLVTLLPEEKGFWFELLEGAGHFLSRTPKQFTIKAPYLNAAVDGTEFVVNAHPQENRVAVMEGAVRVSNDLGEVRLNEGTQTTATANSAPSAVQSIRLQDAAEWILYYPPLVVQVNAPAPVETLIQQENYGEALAELTTSDLTAETTALAASLAFNTGNIQQGEQLLTDALRINSNQAEARALQALRTLIGGDSEGALAQTTQLIQTHPQNPSALLAHAYTQQSRGKIEEALQTNLQAQALIPNNLFVLARTAELQMSVGNTRAAQKLINQALKQAPKHSRLNTLAGFIALNRFATDKAQDHFQTAIQTSSNEPLARLGLALALIQNGKIEAGRAQMEMAVLLDPGSSLLRSYLGKTYATQNQNDWADTQYQLAKSLDPNDPTPWFYEAHLKHEENKPGEALRLINTAIEKNDNRAVYRSRMLLDSDAAARSANMAGIYDTLGFTETAKNTAALAVSENPTDFASHQALVMAHSGDPEAQVLRAREAQMTRMLAPIGAKELNVGVSEAGLQTYPWVSPSRMGTNEYTSLFAQRGLNGSFTSFLGSQESKGFDWQVQAIGTRTSISGGQYNYKTDGYRTNNDLDIELTEINLHHQVTDNTKILLTSSKNSDSSGDLTNSIDSEFFDENLRRANTTNKSEAGLAYRPSKNIALLANINQYDVKANTKTTIFIPPDFTIESNLASDLKEKNFDLLTMFNLKSGNMKVGIKQENAAIESPPFLPGETENIETDDTIFRKIYSSYTHQSPKSIEYLLGLNYSEWDNKPYQQLIKDDHLGHRLGVRIPISHTILTLANWRAVSEFLPRNGDFEDAQIFEITTIDNTSAFTPIQASAANLSTDLLATKINLGFSHKEYSKILIIGTTDRLLQIEEDTISIDFEKELSSSIHLYTSLSFMDNQSPLNSWPDSATIGNFPFEITNGLVLSGLNFLFSSAAQCGIEVLYIDQKLGYLDPTTSNEEQVGATYDKSNSFMLNAKTKFFLQKGSLSIKLEGYNLADKKFSFYPESIQNTITSYIPTPPAIPPRRSILGTIVFNF
jgi:Tfp pilus assembly protein PilF